MHQRLPEGYELKILSKEEFNPLWKEHSQKIFDDGAQIFRLFQFLTEDEKKKTRELQALMGTPFELNLGLYYKGEFAGWCAGHQESSETFYMRNSAILPAHRRKGLYTAMLQRTIDIATSKGFQKIYSRPDDEIKACLKL